MSDRAFVVCGKDADTILQILSLSGQVDLSLRLKQQGLLRGDLIALLEKRNDPTEVDLAEKAREAIKSATGWAFSAQGSR